MNEFEEYAYREINKLQHEKELLIHERSICTANLRIVEARIEYFKSKLNDINRLLNANKLNKNNTKTDKSNFPNTSQASRDNSSRIESKFVNSKGDHAKLKEDKQESLLKKNARRSSSANQLERTELEPEYGLQQIRNRVFNLIKKIIYFLKANSKFIIRPDLRF